jgi:hypothetical protein
MLAFIIPNGTAVQQACRKAENLLKDSYQVVGCTACKITKYSRPELLPDRKPQLISERLSQRLRITMARYTNKLLVQMYGPPRDCKGKVEESGNGLRKCIRLLSGAKLRAMMRCALAGPHKNPGFQEPFCTTGSRRAV